MTNMPVKRVVACSREDFRAPATFSDAVFVACFFLSLTEKMFSKPGCSITYAANNR